MNAGSPVYNITVSRDGMWVVSGTHGGLVTVWNSESHSKWTEFGGHREEVFAVDVSPDATKIATGSRDKTACVWSLSTGQLLLDPFRHDFWVAAVKASSPRRHGVATLFGCTTVRTAASSSSSQSKSTRS